MPDGYEVNAAGSSCWEVGQSFNPAKSGFAVSLPGPDRLPAVSRFRFHDRDLATVGAGARRAKAGECFRELRLGKPFLTDGMCMTYVHILRSMGIPERHFVEVTGDLGSRLHKHNAREVSHTSKYAPREIKTYIAVAEEKRAFAFEKYLKSPSSRVFAKKRL